MKSRNLLLEVVESLGIDMSVYTDGRVRNINLYKSDLNPITVLNYETTSKAYDELLVVAPMDNERFAFGPEEQLDTFRFDLPFLTPFGRFTISRNPDSRGGNDRVLLQFKNPSKVARAYANQLTIRPVGATDLLSMSLEDPVPERAKDIILGVIRTYDSITISVKNQTADKTIAFVNERIGEFSSELNDVEKRAEEFIRNNDLLIDIPTNTQLQLNELRAVESQLAEIRLQLNSVEYLAEYLQEDRSESK